MDSMEVAEIILEFHLVLLIVKIESGYITGMATMIG